MLPQELEARAKARRQVQADLEQQIEAKRRAKEEEKRKQEEEERCERTFPLLPRCIAASVCVGGCVLPGCARV
jgi:hypothetical protein